MTHPDENIPQTLSARIAQQLRMDIIRKEIASGSRITAKEVADMWNTSQVPVREAFSMLAGEGLLEINAYRGAVVNELSEDSINEINAIVGMIEILLVKKGMEIGYPKELVDELWSINHELEELAEKISDDDNRLAVERVTLNVKFHRTMYTLAKGTETYRLYNRYITYLEAVRQVYAMPRKRVLETIDEHYRMVDAIRNNDVDELVKVVELHSENSKVRFGLYKNNII